MSRNFDAVDDKLEVSAAAVTAYPLTMACWFRSGSATADQCLMSIWDAGGSPVARWNLIASGATAGDPIIAQAQAGGSSRNANTTTGYSTNTWHHACGRFTSATSRDVYIDGGSKGSNTTSNTPTGLDTTGIGTREGGLFMNGRIAEAGIWNVSLTEGEINALAKGVSPLRIRPSALVAYWPLYGVASPENNHVGASFHLTVTGATQSFHPPVASFFGLNSGWRGAFTTAAAPSGWAHLFGNKRNRLVYAG